jgi:AcrR family transcriptional regulator
MSTKIIKKRTGGRSARVRQDVLKHALFELIEQGYMSFNISQIATRANVHETTIYRRWPTREALMMDAISEFAHNQLMPVNTGNLATDLRHTLGLICNFLQSQIGKTLIMLAFNPDLPPQLQQLTLALWQDRMHIGQKIFGYAIARGEWPKDYDHNLVFNEIIGPLLSHYCLLKQPMSEQLLNQRVNFILNNRHTFAVKCTDSVPKPD